MATKRRHHFLNTQPHKKIALWSSRKRPHDDEPYTNSKRQRTHEPQVPHEPHEPHEQIMQELERMKQSMLELTEHQQMCYKIMAGQSAQIRQMEHQLLLIKNPVGEPYIPNWVT